MYNGSRNVDRFAPNQWCGGRISHGIMAQGPNLTQYTEMLFNSVIVIVMTVVQVTGLVYYHRDIK